MTWCPMDSVFVDPSGSNPESGDIKPSLRSIVRGCSFRPVTSLFTFLAVLAALISFAVWGFRLAARYEQALVAAQEQVHQLGGSLNIDLVDGYYVVKLPPTATDKEVKELIPHFRRLYTGPSIRSPGDSLGPFAFWLSGTQITDEGIKCLSELPLGYLHLDDTQLTDRGLSYLHRQEGLTLVTLKNTGVTDAGVAALERARPRCWVVDSKTE
jgi:hypothetical protein